MISIFLEPHLNGSMILNYLYIQIRFILQCILHGSYFKQLTSKTTILVSTVLKYYLVNHVQLGNVYYVVLYRV